MGDGAEASVVPGLDAFETLDGGKSDGLLVELVRDLQGYWKVDWSMPERAPSDARHFKYTARTETRTRIGNVELPNRF